MAIVANVFFTPTNIPGGHHRANVGLAGFLKISFSCKTPGLNWRLMAVAHDQTSVRRALQDGIFSLESRNPLRLSAKIACWKAEKNVQKHHVVFVKKKRVLPPSWNPLSVNFTFYPHMFTFAFEVPKKARHCHFRTGAAIKSFLILAYECSMEWSSIRRDQSVAFPSLFGFPVSDGWP